MIESGRVVAIEADALWVETQQKTTCGNCTAQKGCGQSLLQQLYPGRANQLRVLINEVQNGSVAAAEDMFNIGDRVEFSVPDHLIVKGSLLLYLVPVLCLLLGAVLGGRLFASELAVIITAAAGFCVGAAGVRLLCMAQANDKSLQPRLSRRLANAAGGESLSLNASSD